jgi:hypothetical protein
LQLASAGSHSSTSGGIAAACGGSAGGAAAAAGACGGVLDPGLRLRVRSLRGPLEDAMRCYSEVRELVWDRQPALVSCTRCRTAPMTTAAAVTCLSLPYLMLGLMSLSRKRMCMLPATTPTCRSFSCLLAVLAAVAAASLCSCRRRVRSQHCCVPLATLLTCHA